MKFINYWKAIEPSKKNAVALVLAAVLIFSAGLSCGKYSKVTAVLDKDTSQLVNNILGVQQSQGDSQQAQTQTPSQSQTQTPSSSDNTASTPSADTNTNTGTDDTKKDDTKTDAPASSTGMPEGTEAIVSYYNEAANKVKSNASTVTLNYVDRMANDEYLEVSGTLKSVASFAMNTFLTKDENPVTLTGDDIKTTFPVKNEDYSSKLTSSQVKSATCTDNGSEYEIRIELLNDDTPNCTAGNGYGACMNYLGAEEITLDYPGLSISDVKLTYHDGVINAKVDKATGNLVYANYTLPVVLALNAKLFTSSIPAQIGMTFVEDYTIAY